jgi:hypothetical protein
MVVSPLYAFIARTADIASCNTGMAEASLAQKEAGSHPHCPFLPNAREMVMSLVVSQAAISHQTRYS